MNVSMNEEGLNLRYSNANYLEESNLGEIAEGLAVMDSSIHEKTS